MSKAEPSLKKILISYLDAKTALDEATANLEEQKEVLKQALEYTDDKRAELPGVATFTLRQTHTYKYSKNVETLENHINKKREEFEELILNDVSNLKDLKKKEIKEETAEVVDTKVVPVMTLIK